MVFRLPAALLVIVALGGCQKSIQSRDKVQEAIVKRLQASTGLDLQSLDVTTTAVTFDKNLAYATVAFHPKSDPTITNGMVMKYTLENREGKWVVVNVADSQGHGLSGHGAAGSTQLPAGHPPVDPTRPGDATGSGAGTPNGLAR